MGNCACTDVVDTAPEVVDTLCCMASCSMTNSVKVIQAQTDSVKVIQAHKHVSFSDLPAEVLEIVPYSEMYGLHPSKFEFDRDGHYIVDDKSIDARLQSATFPARSKTMALRASYLIPSCLTPKK